MASPLFDSRPTESTQVRIASSLALRLRNVSLLSFYFPQFHPIPENDRFWGQNFTEWTNVKKLLSIASPYREIRVPASELGMYDLRDKRVRRRQAELASRHGINGFIYYHYWFSGKPVMDQVLRALLVDGEPNLAFSMCWANEHWTKKWDGGSNEILLKQEYDVEESRAHYEFLRQFWSHPLHVRTDEKRIPFFVYRIQAQHAQELWTMFQSWKAWLLADGIGELHVVQLMGFDASDAIVSWSDGIGEFWPLYPNVLSRLPRGKLNIVHRCHYPGVVTSFDNSPRHTSDGKAYISQKTPYAFGKELRAAMAAASYLPPSCGSYVLVSSWNEWGEGNILEPDSVRHLAVLAEVSSSVRHWQNPKANNICFVARTYAGHQSDPFYNVSAFIDSIRALPYAWRVLLVSTDIDSPGYQRYLESIKYQEDRISVLSPPDSLKLPYDSCLSAYHITDWAIRQCPTDTEWLVVTNADNSYGPNSMLSLEMASEDVDIVLLPMRTRYVRLNHFRGLHIPDCSEVIEHSISPEAALGKTDLGQMVIRYRRLIADEVYFSAAYPQLCQAEDWETLNRILNLNWHYIAPTAAASLDNFFMHNPNPDSCGALGGVWQDSGDFGRFACVSSRRVDAYVRSPFGAFPCVRDKSSHSWQGIPSMNPTVQNAEMARGIARSIANKLEDCGLRFDATFFSLTANVHAVDAISYWQREGFLSGLPYRLLREANYSPPKFFSDDCFLIRAISSRFVVRQLHTCNASPEQAIFYPLVRNISEYCNLALDARSYVTEHRDVIRSGLSGEDHFWMYGLKEGRRAIFTKAMFSETISASHCDARALSVFCNGLPRTITISDIYQTMHQFVRVCQGCIKVVSDPYTAHTCGFAVDTHWLLEMPEKLCVHVSK